jgi:hypothetical protein
MSTYSGLWNGHYGQTYSALGANNTVEQNNTTRSHLTKLVARGRGNRKLMALMRALNGVAAGGTAAVSHVQRTATPDLTAAYSGGGAVPIATVSDVNRVTTAADQTLINAIFDKVFAPSPYPTDASGNGGGNKVGKF